ncbi:MAG: pyridoxal phosphate-dependent decarboxylase family protein [Alphaproteobacteria bacterium]
MNDISDGAVLRRAQEHAVAFLDGLDKRPICATAGADELRRRLGGPLPAQPSDVLTVIDELVRDVEGGILGSTGGRFFGWVIGGALPVALAADWLTATWDQNAASYACSPAEAVIEEVCGAWLKELLGLPATASFAFVTGCQMAHTTALAAARHKLLRTRGFDVERRGLSAAPALRVLATENRHESILRSVRLLGIGSDAVELLPSDDAGGMRLEALAAALARGRERPTVVCLQAGDLHSGAFDPFARVSALAREAAAWVHVDGAFGLWAATSGRYRHLLAGVELADSWATDGHKWLNLPFDSGFVFVADPDAHRAVFAQPTSYAAATAGVREEKDWNPEWSRRGRAVAAYAAIRALGRSGIAEIVERCCDFAARLVEGLAALPGVEVLARPRINQALVRFLDAGGDHDRRTDQVIARIQASGEAWFGGTTWRGMRAMRISVCNWRTGEGDIEPVLAVVRRSLGNVTGG